MTGLLLGSSCLIKYIAVCLLTFHSPDGSELLISSDTIKAIKPAAQHHGHLADGTNSVIYLGVRPNGFGIQETTHQVLAIIHSCEELANKHP
jgi:hypothetical protein